MIGVEVVAPPPPTWQCETSSKRQKQKSQPPTKDLLVRFDPRNCLCPAMALALRRPWFPETSALCSWEHSWERCANPHSRPHQLNSFPGLSRELLLSALGAIPKMYVPRNFLALFPGTFPNVPRNSSQELFPISSGEEIRAKAARRGLLLFLTYEA